MWILKGLEPTAVVLGLQQGSASGKLSSTCRECGILYNRDIHLRFMRITSGLFDLSRT